MISAGPARTVFLAGAGGVIGRILSRLLVADGWRVVGTTRRADTAAKLRLLGVEPVLVDAFDPDALIRAAVAARPDVVMHQLTDLPKVNDPAIMAAARARNAHLREIGTAHLVAAAHAAGARRIVAQSIAFAYAPGPRPHAEDAPLDPAQRGVAVLESLVLGAAMEGLVLRYGRLYGPDTWTPVAAGEAPVHVAAAAQAARLAARRGAPGVYNVAEDDGTVSSARAREELGWRPEVLA